MTHNRESDKLLLEGFCAGDPECAGEFVEHFLRRLYWIAFRIVGDFGTAEDVVQGTFERAWRSGLTFNPERGSLDAGSVPQSGGF
jgi:DNA-directed RNA polymerase specialized sigma24 family protein